MDKFVEKAGCASGALGLLFFALGVVGRFYGNPRVFGFEAINIVIIGIALMSVAIMFKLHTHCKK